jgi:hypothetical protein
MLRKEMTVVFFGGINWPELWRGPMHYLPRLGEDVATAGRTWTVHRVIHTPETFEIWVYLK